jgi:hypothetical protein
MSENISMARQIVARQVALTLFCAAFLNSSLTLLFGFFVKSKLIIYFGGLGMGFGLCVMLMMAWLYNQICSNGPITPRRSNCYDKLAKALEYAGYAFVLWGIMGIILVTAMI